MKPQMRLTFRSGILAVISKRNGSSEHINKYQYRKNNWISRILAKKFWAETKKKVKKSTRLTNGYKHVAEVHMIS